MNTDTGYKVFEYTKEKSQKITHAILFSLSFSSNFITLKEAIEDQATLLFQHLLMVYNRGWRASKRTIEADAHTLDGLLGVAERLDMFPRGGRKVIADEYIDLIAFLDTYAHLITGEVVRLAPESLGAPLLSENREVSRKHTKGHDKRQNDKEDKTGTVTKGQTKEQIEKTRKMLILAEVEKRGEASIRDVARVLSDQGIKTIQRDLAALVEEGLLHRQGSRRWTVYTLSSNTSI